eukprot:g2756.t1
MSSPLPPPKKRRKPRTARSGNAVRAASGPERAGSSTLTPLALKEQPEAKQPATEQPEIIAPPGSFRSVRLAKLREKAQERGGRLSVQAQARATDSGDVELVVMGRTSEGNSRPVVEPVLAIEEHSMRNRMCGIFVVLTAIIVCVESIVSTERATELGYMNCVRLRTAPHVACLSFSAFLVVAIMFRPALSATASVTHRRIFSMAVLLFVCAIAIAAASIGYPSQQGVCSNCECGVCKVFRSEEQVLEEQNLEEQVLKERIVPCAENVGSIAVISNATNGSEPNASTVIQRKCPTGDDKGVYPPKMCSPMEKDDITVILADEISSSEDAQLLLTIARSMFFTETLVNAETVETLNAIVADPNCRRNITPTCPDHKSLADFIAPLM